MSRQQQQARAAHLIIKPIIKENFTFRNKYRQRDYPSVVVEYKQVVPGDNIPLPMSIYEIGYSGLPGQGHGNIP